MTDLLTKGYKLVENIVPLDWKDDKPYFKNENQK